LVREEENNRREEAEAKKEQESKVEMRARIRRTLLGIYSFIMAASLFFLILIWNPVENALQAYEIQNHTATINPNTKQTLTTIKNQTAIRTINITTVMQPGNSNNITEVFRTEMVRPIAGQAFLTDIEYLYTNREVRLIIISILFGVLGGTIHGIASLSAFRSTRKLTSEWSMWYAARPFLGAALAVIVYLTFRAGLVTGGPSNVSDFGVAAIGALVGLLTEQTTRKLRDVFDTLFGTQKPEKEKGEARAKAASINLIALDDFKVNKPTRLTAELKKSDGTPATGIKVTFVPHEPGIAELKPIMDVTDSKGIATVEIIGKKEGSLGISSKATIEGDQYEDSITITITQ
jgi:hypothetical protein